MFTQYLTSQYNSNMFSQSVCDIILMESILIYCHGVVVTIIEYDDNRITLPT